RGSWRCRESADVREQARLASFLEPLHHRLQDHERHPRQALELLVAVDAPLEVDLAETLDPDALRGIDQMPDLDRIAGEERDRLEQRPAPGVLAGEGVDHPRQLWVEEVDQRSCDELRDAAAAALLEDPLL